MRDHSLTICQAITVVHAFFTMFPKSNPNLRLVCYVPYTCDQFSFCQASERRQIF